MKSDVEIAQSALLQPISKIAAQLGIREDEFSPYGSDKAKLDLKLLDRLSDRPDGKLILVTAISPTPAGEGKTTTNVGLSMALNKLGKKAITTLRQPSLGPVFGVKGGAAGGGYSQVLPMEDINLHFTGDFNAIAVANNLLAALLDNSLYQGNPLQIDPKRVVLKRVIDMNDRALRNILVGLGKRTDGVVREDGFDIVVASEVMAVLCMATGLMDLKERFSRIIPAYNTSNEPITAEDLKASGAMALVMKDAIRPNLVQATENTPAIIHGGPFANIAHGCNSILATKLALKLADFTVTEAGFGADLGAEKFFDIVCPEAGFTPDAVVMVATVRALKYHGGVPKNDLGDENLAALENGIVNLRQHLENMAKYGVPAVVALNHFPTDSSAEIDFVQEACAKMGVPCALSDVFTDGSAGGLELARLVINASESESAFQPIYSMEMPLVEKIETVAREIYRADRVTFSKVAEQQLAKISKLGYGELPVCIAKTQYSFSDDPHLLGAPRDFELTVREVHLNAGAGFVVVKTGEILTMPGLPKKPAAEGMDIQADGTILGLS